MRLPPLFPLLNRRQRNEIEAQRPQTREFGRKVVGGLRRHARIHVHVLGRILVPVDLKPCAQQKEVRFLDLSLVLLQLF